MRFFIISSFIVFVSISFFFFFMYVVYVFDFGVLFGRKSLEIWRSDGPELFWISGANWCGFFNTVLAGRVRNVFFCSSSYVIVFVGDFWTEMYPEFGQPVALLRFSRPLACLSYALLRKLYYYNTTSCHICQPLIVFFLCNFLVDILDGRCYSAV